MRSFHLIVIAAFLVASCDQENSITLVSSPDNKAESVYLTHDENDNAVVAWTERDSTELTLFFSVSSDQGESFDEKVSVPLSGNVATHPESMPKVAFKKDGTIIAAYEKKAPTKENKYAGAIYYVVSKDQGKTWTPETYLHSDTLAGRNRSYFDIERLPDGEIGASWLDVKLNNETGGRSVRFAKTNSQNSFTNELLIESAACECCRIDVYADIAGQVNVAYRGLMKGKMGQSIRDMMIATSNNNGRTFKSPIRISQDNWAIDGCPHTGPSLCSTNAGLFSMWYTEGNGTGIYYSFKGNTDTAFTERELISNAGQHPQLSANTSRFIMVWEEKTDEIETRPTSVVYQMSDGSSVVKGSISPSDLNAFLPVVTQTADGFVVAFLMETASGVRMYTAKL